MADVFLPSCDCKDLLPLAKCFREPCVSAPLRKAIQVVLLNYIIATINSNRDIYTLDELLAKGKCCGCNIESLDRDAIMTYLLWALAQEISQAPPANTGVMLEEACRLVCGSADMDSILTPLWCEFLKGVGDTLTLPA